MNAKFTAASAPPKNGSLTGLRGMVHGGQQPLVGTHIYVYAAATTGYGTGNLDGTDPTAAVSLLTSTPETAADAFGNYYVTTTVGGDFSLTGNYTCVAGTQVYLYAVGGDPNLNGLNGQTDVNDNPGAGLMMLLGQCPASGTFADLYSFVVMNEATTVAAAYALAGFAADPSHVGAPSLVNSVPNALAATGIQNAFINGLDLVDITSGTIRSAVPGDDGVVPAEEIETLADILASCINSPNTDSSPSMACTNLFGTALSGGASGRQPANTASAALNIAHNPGSNVGTLYGYATSQGPFQPGLPSQPNDFSLALTFTDDLMVNPDNLAIDGSGTAWVAGEGNSSYHASLTNITAAGVMTLNSEPQLAPISSIAIDLQGDIWIPNLNIKTIDEFYSGLSGSIQHSIGGYPNVVAVDANGHIWDANVIYYPNSSTLEEFNSAGSIVLSGDTQGCLSQSIISGMAITAGTSGLIWVTQYNDNDLCAFNLSGAAVNSGVTGGGLNHPQSISVDSSGHLWIVNSSGNSLSEFDGATGAAVSATGYTPAGLQDPRQIAIDGASHIWVTSQGNNAVVETDNSGNPLSPSTGYQAGLSTPTSIGVDGSGDLWVSNGTNGDAQGTQVMEFIGLATPVTTPIAYGAANNSLGARP